MDWGDFNSNRYKPKTKIEKRMSDIFTDVMTQDEEEDYTPQLRGSSLPICILLHAHALLDPHVRIQEARLKHYAKQGTAFHELFQDNFMRSKKWGKYLYGDFECPKCETVYYKNCTRPKDYLTHVCKKCGNKGLRYRELEGKYKGVIGVHVDTVLRFPKEDWVVEYKTTGTFNLKDEKMSCKNKHHHQASSYPVVMEDVFGIVPKRYFVIYVNRDAPQHSKTSLRQHRVFPFKTDAAIVRKRKEQLDNTVKAEKQRIKYFNNPTIANLKKLDSFRPCKSKEDYFEPRVGMNDKYEKGQFCPFVKKGECACFSEGLSKAAKDLHKKVKANKETAA